jgi:uncharacterized protein YcbK (DUF882 family)
MRGTVALAAGLFGALVLAGEMDAARAGGDAKTLSFFHTHTRERATVTFWRDGRYDEDGLRQLNHFLRDWRNDKEATMDPALFSVLWEVYQASGSNEPIHIISSYRSPETNGMLHRRSKGVSEHSQHMLGKAMDIRLPDVDSARVRAIAMKLQYGGVGYYPGSNFVHVDVAGVRAWPRMSEQQLARLFPDGKTVHLPPSGKPLARYEEARAEVQARKQMLASATSGSGSLPNLIASLFRGGSKQIANADPDAAIVTASLPTGSDVTVKEEPPVPFPPPRPASPPARTAAAEPASATRTGMQEQPVRFASEPSRLVLSRAPISEQPPADFDRPRRVAMQVLPSGSLTAEPKWLPYSMPFRGSLSIEVEEQRFRGSSVSLVPVWRVAQAGP